MIEKEYIVNEYIVLRLEEGKANIYVKGVLFQQCKSLIMLNPQLNSNQWDVNSIDQASNILISDQEREISPSDLSITPEEEFWGHCSNLQVWVENNYDPRLLHSSLSFPLLKELVDIGMQRAKIILKEAIAKRLESGDDKVKQYLIEEGYLNYLEHDELLQSMLNKHDYDVIVEIENLFRENQFSFVPMEIRFDDSFNSGFTTKDREVSEIDIYSALDFFPEPLTKLRNLRKLNLINCNIKEIPSSIQNLKKLEIINLEFNALSEISIQITMLPSLRELYLGYNRIECIPDSLKNLESLRKLGLNNNRLNSINKIIGVLDRLEDVSISGNDYYLKEELPQSIGNLKLDKNKMYYNVSK